MAEISGELAAEIVRLRELKGLSRRDVAAECGITYAYVSMLETRKATFNPQSPFALKFGELVGVPSSHWLPFTEKGRGMLSLVGSKFPARSLPLIGVVSAGPGADEPIHGQSFAVPEGCPGDAAYLVEGGSMGDKIPCGSVVVVRTQPGADDGEIVVAYVGGVGMIIKVLGADKLYSVGDSGQHYTRGPKVKVCGVFVRAFPPPEPKPKKKRK